MHIPIYICVHIVRPPQGGSHRACICTGMRAYTLACICMYMHASAESLHAHMQCTGMGTRLHICIHAVHWHWGMWVLIDHSLMGPHVCGVRVWYRLRFMQYMHTYAHAYICTCMHMYMHACAQAALQGGCVCTPLDGMQYMHTYVHACMCTGCASRRLCLHAT